LFNRIALLYVVESIYFNTLHRLSDLPLVAALDDVIDGQIVRWLRRSVEPIRISEGSCGNALGQVELGSFVVITLEEKIAITVRKKSSF